jgi:hypothetical protein
MGYSCSRDAANTLGVIGKMFATDGNPNTLTIKNQGYFFERGGEQRDGAITGTSIGCSRTKCAVRLVPQGSMQTAP